MAKTNIEWADETWPVTRGCTRVSTGCTRCYAESMAVRIIRMGKGRPTKYDGLVRVIGGEPSWTGTARFCPEELATPLRQRKGRRIFVSSMSDLFHDDITNEQIAAVFGVMAACPQHVFMVLTKRARRMREWFEWVEERGVRSMNAMAGSGDGRGQAWKTVRACIVEAARVANNLDRNFGHTGGLSWPLPNVMLGVSAENQAAADERLPELLRAPAAVRWISAEPLLGPIDFVLRGHRIAGWDEDWKYDVLAGREWASPRDDREGTSPHIGLVITGCESGHGSRPCDVAWFRSLRDQCAEAGVPFFLKQAHDDGAEHFGVDCEGKTRGITCGRGSHRKPGGIIGAPYLDGVQHLAFPEVPRG